MMGVGKTTIGKLLSKKLKMRFQDLDTKIETRESLKISEIFQSKGEKYFREVEQIESLNIIKEKDTILALGGGTFINPIVRKNIKKFCFSVWLDHDPQEIFKRIKGNKKRPLLMNAKSKKDVEKIYIKRKKIYSLADYKLNCASKNKKEIVDEIEKVYENIKS